MIARYTFLLPAYKSRFFAEALQSIKGQTYTDFMVIVSDDCSPEDLNSIYDREVGDDPRFTYRRNEENMGSKSLVSHWNLLVDMCDTEFLIMASDDDFYAPNYLAEINELVEKYPEVGMIRGRMVKWYMTDGKMCEDDNACERMTTLEYLFNKYTTVHQAGLQNFTFRTSVLKDMGGFVNFPLAWFSDDATILACSSRGVCYTKDIVFTMRISGQNITCKSDRNTADQKLIATMQYGDWIYHFLNKIYDNSTEKLSKKTTIVKEGVDNHIRRLALDYYLFASWSKALSLFWWMNKHRLLTSIYSYLKDYLRARIIE